MKRSREALNERIMSLISKTEERRKLYSSLEEKFEMPISLTADICAGRELISEHNDFVAFCMLSGLTPDEVGKYFTDDEIKMFSAEKFEKPEFELPLVFKNMVQISQDQWIGRITAKELMALKEAQVIKYNENTQRTMKRIVRGESRYYKIALNEKSVREIKEALESGIYISDDITLNMPVETTEFTYNKGNITISELDKLDIIDGYHRYIAISRAMLENEDFDYPMELRLVNYSEEKAKQLIYQKDQKTKMRQVDSAALNQYNPANIVIDQLNSDPGSNIQGMVARNGGKINQADLSAFIHAFYFPTGKATRKDILEVKKDLQQKFNSYISSDLNLVDHVFTLKETAIIIYCFKNVTDYIDAIKYLIENEDKIPTNLFNSSGKVRRKLVNEINALLEER